MFNGIWFYNLHFKDDSNIGLCCRTYVGRSSCKYIPITHQTVSYVSNQGILFKGLTKEAQCVQHSTLLFRLWVTAEKFNLYIHCDLSFWDFTLKLPSKNSLIWWLVTIISIQQNVMWLQHTRTALFLIIRNLNFNLIEGILFRFPFYKLQLHPWGMSVTTNCHTG